MGTPYGADDGPVTVFAEVFAAREPFDDGPLTPGWTWGTNTKAGKDEDQ